MRLTKFVKRVTALAMCGMMFVETANMVGAYSDTRIVTDASGIKYSETYIYRDTKEFYMETEVVKDAYGSNKYASNITAHPYLRDSRSGAYVTYDYYDNVTKGSTDNPKVEDRYTDFSIIAVSGAVTTGGRTIVINY